MVMSKYENKGGDMIEIVQHYQNNYVPLVQREDTVYMESIGESTTFTASHKLLFGGDQLTVARASSAIRNVGNGNNSSTQLLGLIPVIEDWHTKMTLLSVCLYSITKNVHYYIKIGYMETLLFFKVIWVAWNSISIKKSIRKDQCESGSFKSL